MIAVDDRAILAGIAGTVACLVVLLRAGRAGERDAAG